MKKALSALTIFILGIGIGASTNFAGAADSAVKPAFMIVSSNPNPGADYGPYGRAAGPLAQAAGLQMLAPAQEPLVLEGNWPYGNVILEVYPSMDALNDFWYSDGYQQAKKLREGLATVNFIIAVEGN